MSTYAAKKHAYKLTPKQKWWVIFMLILILSTFSFGPSLIKMIFQKPSGKIFFQCWIKQDRNSEQINDDPVNLLNPESKNGLCTINPNGTGFKVIDVYEHSPEIALLSWSPDWMHIAFKTTVGGIDSLSIAEIDESATTKFTGELGVIGKVSWSPDGKTLAFAKFDDTGKGKGIYTIQVDGNHLTQVSTFGDGPVWSPDDKTIAFTNNGDGIYLLNTSTGKQTQIANGFSASTLAWSPNGLMLVYQSSDKKSNELGLINVDGSNRQQFYGAFSSPAWSPDGTKIAYLCGYELCTMNSDGSSPAKVAPDFLTKVITVGSQVTAFTWSPNSQHILVLYRQGYCPTCGSPERIDKFSHLWIINADGSQASRLRTNVHGTLLWRP